MCNGFRTSIHGNNRPGGCATVFELPSTETTVLVDEQRFSCFHPRKRPSSWMCNGFRASIHGNDRPGGCAAEMDNRLAGFFEKIVYLYKTHEFPENGRGCHCRPGRGLITKHEPPYRNPLLRHNRRAKRHDRRLCIPWSQRRPVRRADAQHLQCPDNGKTWTRPDILRTHDGGPIYKREGRFVAAAHQPVWFGKPQLFSPRESGNSFYTSYTEQNGEGVLWFGDRKYCLFGKVMN